MTMLTNRFAFTRSYHRTIHARKRARQRYAIDLSPALLVRIAQAVRDGLATAMGRDVYTVSLPKLDPTFPNIEVIVAFDPWRDEIASILPPDWTVERAEHHDRVHHGIEPTMTPAKAPTPPTHRHVEPDLKIMTLVDAKVWRENLIEALKTAPKSSRAHINDMIGRVNKRIKKLNIKAEAALREKARERREQDAIDKNRLDQDSMTMIFEEMWREDHPDQ